jgi:hypothetical protein
MSHSLLLFSLDGFAVFLAGPVEKAPKGADRPFGGFFAAPSGQPWSSPLLGDSDAPSVSCRGEYYMLNYFCKGIIFKRWEPLWLAEALFPPPLSGSGRMGKKQLGRYGVE